MTLEDDVIRLMDYEAIRQLVANYAVAIDSRDLDRLVNLFVEDVAVGKSNTGRAALKEYFRQGLAPLGSSILSLTTHVIDFDDATQASGEVYCTGEIERDGHYLRQAILYRDRYAKTEEGWKFIDRDHLLWYSAPEATNPRDLPPANWPRGHVGRGTLPEAFESFRRFQAENPQN